MEALLQALQRIFLQPLVLGGVDLGFTLLRLILVFVLPVLGTWLLLRIVGRLVARRLERSELEEQTRNRIQRAVRITRRLILVAVILATGGSLAGAQTFIWMREVLVFLNQPLINSQDGTGVSLATLLLLIPVFWVANWLSLIGRRFIDDALLNRLSMDPSRRFGISSLFRYAVLAVAAIVGLSIIGLNLSTISVLIGALGIGVGFGLQNTVANFFAGLIIILTQPIKEGDRILVGDVEGDVVQIRILNSVVNTIRNESIILPNARIVENQVFNYSYDDPSIITANDVQVAYGTDLDRAVLVLSAAAAESPFAVAGKVPTVLVKSFDSSGISLSVLCTIRNAKDRIGAMSWMNLRIYRALRENAITIPFPQLDLHLDSPVEELMEKLGQAKGKNAGGQSPRDGDPGG